MVTIHPAIITGVATAVLTSWLSDQLPRPGLPATEIERRLRNIVLSMITGFGVAYIAMAVTGQMPQTQTQTVRKQIVLPGYYGD
ncbi:MAG: hypothetical protein NDF54_07345 [archaeon GB-1867-035]|nr:hypothetical protein [Candidatus Culexmicrobium profundum]